MYRFRSLPVLLVAVAGVAHAADAPSFLRQPDPWFSSDEGRSVIRNLISWQMPHGGWQKAYDATRPRTPTTTSTGWTIATFDNGATHSELKLLARAVTLTKEDDAKAAFLLGLDASLDAQYDNGGFPQRFPPPNNYGREITFNDGAMIGILEVIRDVAAAKPPYAFVDEPRRARCQKALDQAVDCILKCQVVKDGVPTIWASQYDEKTFTPAKARAYELPALCSPDSVGVALLLMSLPDPSPAVQKAVHAAAAWFDANKIVDKKIEAFTDPDGKPERRLIDAPGNVLWARFYDLDTGQPLFVGRDGIKKWNVADIERERRVGYAWYINWGTRVTREYATWKTRHPAP